MFQILVGTNWKFMNKRRATYVLSVLLIAASIGILVVRGGPKESIDFTGGNLLYVGFNRAVPVTDVRDAAQRAQMDGAEVQMAENGTQAIIRFRTVEGDTTNQFSNFRTAYGTTAPQDSVILMSQETVGPKIGEELERKAAMAILWSLILILGYIAFRFRRISFGIGAVIALFHDILIALGVMTFLGKEVSLTVVAAFLTIGGYSINDTIVVFDRIRENSGLARRLSFQGIVDRSINQTLSRTILTSTTTILAVLALFFLGGVVIHDFALAMLVGVVIGTYSSIFVASALALDISNWWVGRKTAREKSGRREKTKAIASR